MIVSLIILFISFTDSTYAKKNCMANLTGTELSTMDYGKLSYCSKTVGGAWWFTGSDCGTTNLNANSDSGAFQWCSENLYNTLMYLNLH